MPGDKSVCHRSIMLGALATGETTVKGFVPGADCLSTVRCIRALGAQVEDLGAGDMRVQGVGLNGLKEAEDVLDAGNSGTTVRLLSGILAGQPFYTTLTGDWSLRRRPMARIVEPLTRMGARIMGRGGDRLLPLAIRGGDLRSIEYCLPVASAQVKSCVILAALFADGETTVVEPAPTRDHTERMMRAMGARVDTDGNRITLRGGQPLKAVPIEVPGDISSAAFFLVAGAITPGSDVVIEGVGVNPTRTGILDILSAMGADITMENGREVGGEPIADLRVRTSALRATTVEGNLVPRAIDELPVLAVAATQAEGRTLVREAQELRVKETDRIKAIVTELKAMGARIEEQPDGFIVDGPTPLRGASVKTYGDHRMAMSLAVAGLVAEGQTTIEGTECAVVSFPGFFDKLNSLSDGAVATSR